jgi:hypothetical protein
MLRKGPLQNRFDQYKINITVNGRTDLQVGDTVLFRLRGDEIVTKEDKFKTAAKQNGVYMIAAIVHRISPYKHQMVMQLVKESNIED